MDISSPVEIKSPIRRPLQKPLGKSPMTEDLKEIITKSIGHNRISLIGSSSSSSPPSSSSHSTLNGFECSLKTHWYEQTVVKVARSSRGLRGRRRRWGGEFGTFYA